MDTVSVISENPDVVGAVTAVVNAILVLINYIISRRKRRY